MIPFLVAFASGVLFALGLGISGMTLPARVVGFLDVAGAWDPSLAFVMIGAIGVHFFLVRAALRRQAPIFGGRFALPTRKDIDARLLLGAAIFGVGWGLGGLCPGPGLVSLASGAASPFIFVAAMMVGMQIARLFEPGNRWQEAGANSSREVALPRANSSGHVA